MCTVRYWATREDLNTKLRVTVGTRESNERFVSLVTRLLKEVPEAQGNGAKRQKK